MIVKYFDQVYYKYIITIDEEKDLIIEVSNGGFRLTYQEFFDASIYYKI